MKGSEQRCIDYYGGGDLFGCKVKGGWRFSVSSVFSTSPDQIPCESTCKPTQNSPDQGGGNLHSQCQRAASKSLPVGGWMPSHTAQLWEWELGQVWTISGIGLVGSGLITADTAATDTLLPIAYFCTRPMQCNFRVSKNILLFDSNSRAIHPSLSSYLTEAKHWCCWTVLIRGWNRPH